jgi:glycosyltransferase involved in cell wall biosynthesis
MLKRAVLPANDVGAQLLDVVEEIERRAIGRASAVIACSPDDLEELRGFAPTLAEFVLVPNGADVSRIPFVTTPRRRRRASAYLSALAGQGLGHFEHVALFVASYHPPNNDAASTIVSFAPLLPRALFVLVGSHVNALSGQHLPPNVLPRGIVSEQSLATLLASADVALNPMRIGSGTNVKLFEAFAAGVPVVSTEVGARGSGAVDGEHLVMTSIAGFPLAIERLLEEPERAHTLAKSARALAEERYDWAGLGSTMADAIERAMAGGASA